MDFSSTQGNTSMYPWKSLHGPIAKIPWIGGNHFMHPWKLFQDPWNSLEDNGNKG
jgi:hypothetical protein